MRFATIALTLTLLLASCSRDEPKPLAPTGGIPWGASIDEAVARARTSRKPVLVHFFAPW